MEESGDTSKRRSHLDELMMTRRNFPDWIVDAVASIANVHDCVEMGDQPEIRCEEMEEILGGPSNEKRVVKRKNMDEQCKTIWCSNYIALKKRKTRFMSGLGHSRRRTLQTYRWTLGQDEAVA